MTEAEGMLPEGFDVELETSERFIPLARFPIVSPTTSLSDTLLLMRTRGTCAALIQHGASTFKLLTVEPGTGHLSLEPEAGRVAGIVVPQDPTAEVGDLGRTVVTVEPESMTFDEGALAATVKGILRQGKLAGLFAFDVKTVRSLLAPPRIYACKAEPRHYYHPPPPAACLVDGTAVGPA